jgi:tetratricopeptide (TPR) repeat protein
MAADDVDYSYVAIYGIERPDLVRDSGIAPDMLRLYAGVKKLKANPENGLAALEIANAFGDLDDADGVKIVLESLERGGDFGFYPLWYEDPTFHLGWYMADFKRYDEAIDAYRRSISKQYNDGKWAVWSHLGSVYHELRQFEEAKQCYQDALRLLAAEPTTGKVDTSRYADSIKNFLAHAISGELFTGERYSLALEFV